MVKDQQGVAMHRHLSVSSALVLAELDFEVVVGEALDDGSHLASYQAVSGIVHQQGYHVENVEGRRHRGPRACQYSGRRRPWATARTARW